MMCCFQAERVTFVILYSTVEVTVAVVGGGVDVDADESVELYCCQNTPAKEIKPSCCCYLSFMQFVNWARDKIFSSAYTFISPYSFLGYLSGHKIIHQQLVVVIVLA